MNHRLRRTVAVFLTFLLLIDPYLLAGLKNSPLVYFPQGSKNPPDIPAQLIYHNTHEATNLQGPLIGKTIWLIQDIHLNGPAQHSLAKAMGSMIENGQISLVALEGAWGLIDNKSFRSQPRTDITRRVAKQFFEDLRIGAPSVAALNAQKNPPPYVGVDSPDLYEKNVKAYQKAIHQQKFALSKIERELAKLNQLKNLTLNPPLRHAERLIYSYENGTAPLKDLLPLFLTHPTSLASLNTRQRKNLAHLIRASELEHSLDLAVVKKEYRRIMDILLPTLSRDEFLQLEHHSRQLKEGQHHQAEFLRHLKTLVDRKGILRSWPDELQTYFESLSHIEKISTLDAFIGIQNIIDALYTDLIKTPEEANLINQTRTLLRQKKLVSFSCTPDEWTPLKKEPGFEPFKLFYELAELRSQAMVQSLLRNAKAIKTDKPIFLIVGGFHMPDMRDQLAQLGARVLVLSPRIENLDNFNSSDYLKSFTPKKSPFPFMTFWKHTLYPAHTILGSTSPQAQTTNIDFRDEYEKESGVMSSPSTNSSPRIVRMMLMPSFLSGSLTGLVVMAASVTAMALWTGDLTWLLALGVVVAPDSSHHPQESWLARKTPGLLGKQIMEITMEMALSGEIFQRLEKKGLPSEIIRLASMATSAGGIGPLLKERIIAQSHKGANVIGVTLLYDNVWSQEIVSMPGSGRARDLVMARKPIGDVFRKYILEPAPELNFDLEMFDGHIAHVKVWRAPPGTYGNATVYFFDCPEITDVLYTEKSDRGGFFSSWEQQEQAMRQKERQNWLVGRGSLILSKKLNHAPDFRVLSEMPTIFANHRLVADQHFKREDNRFQNDLFFANTLDIFNDHTPLDYAHPHLSQADLNRLKVDPRYYEHFKPLHNIWNHDRIDGTAMIINAVNAVFGVAKNHQRVMRAMNALSTFAEKIQAVTNGVSPWYWPSGFLRKQDRLRHVSNRRLVQWKKAQRYELIRYLGKRLQLGDDWVNNAIKNNFSVGIWVRRLVQYKRVDLLVSILSDNTMRQQFIDSNQIIVWGGRIHQDNQYGIEQFGRLENLFVHYPVLRERVLFFDNYNIWEAPHLFRGADFSIMTADDGQEASATGFQKVQMSGGLVIGSPDGAVPESVWFDGEDKGPDCIAPGPNGFKVPYANMPGRPRPEPTSEGLFNALQAFSTVFHQGLTDPSVGHYGQMVRNAMLAKPWVSVERTAEDQLKLLDKIRAETVQKKELEQEGRRLIQEAFTKLHIDLHTASTVLNEVPPFSWKYRPYNSYEFEVYRSQKGLAGLIDSIRYVESLGTLGEWVLKFHLSNHDGHEHKLKGYGDLIIHIQDALMGNQNLKPLIDLFKTLGQTMKDSEIDSRLKSSHILIGMLEQLKEELTRVISDHTISSDVKGPSPSPFSHNHPARKPSPKVRGHFPSLIGHGTMKIEKLSLDGKTIDNIQVQHLSETIDSESVFSSGVAVWESYLWHLHQYYPDEFQKRYGEGMTFETEFRSDDNQQTYMKVTPKRKIIIDDEALKLDPLVLALILNHESCASESQALLADLAFYRWAQNERFFEWQRARRRHPVLFNDVYFSFLEKNARTSQHDNTLAVAKFMLSNIISELESLWNQGKVESFFEGRNHFLVFVLGLNSPQGFVDVWSFFDFVKRLAFDLHNRTIDEKFLNRLDVMTSLLTPGAAHHFPILKISHQKSSGVIYLKAISPPKDALTRRSTFPRIKAVDPNKTITILIAPNNIKVGPKTLTHVLVEVVYPQGRKINYVLTKKGTTWFISDEEGTPLENISVQEKVEGSHNVLRINFGQQALSIIEGTTIHVNYGRKIIMNGILYNLNPGQLINADVQLAIADVNEPVVYQAPRRGVNSYWRAQSGTTRFWEIIAALIISIQPHLAGIFDRNEPVYHEPAYISTEPSGPPTSTIPSLSRRRQITEKA